MQEALIGDAFDHEADLVGVRHEHQLLAAAANLGEHVVDARTTYAFAKRCPVVGDPVLHWIFVPDWPGNLAQFLDQRKHLVGLQSLPDSRVNPGRAEYDCDRASAIGL
jgi:hypothetical protein